MLRKIVSFVVLFGCILFGSQSSDVHAQGTDAGNGFSIFGSATLVTDHRFKGMSFTNFQPAAQVFVSLSHSSGFYLNSWNTNVSSYNFPGATMETDAYLGWKTQLKNGVRLDMGVQQSYLPGSSSYTFYGNNAPFVNTDLYFSVGYGSFTAKYNYTVSDFFNTPNSAGNQYFNLTADFDLGDKWTLSPHLGYQTLRNSLNMNFEPINGFVDYSLSLKKEINGWVLGATVVGASANNYASTSQGYPAGRIGVVGSLTKYF
jgi:uncharacterized protein (TIGR02001 family)